MRRCLIRIRGIVQGVGFRPFIYNLAKSLYIKGFVQNTSDGVIIDAQGENIDDFIASIKGHPPPLAKIESIEIHDLPLTQYDDFTITESDDEHSRFTLISPDVSTCKDCLTELLNPTDRRYLYPFINCTNCGPRYSITQRVPYDRVNTTMSVFKMCHDCQSEYQNPTDRRFHAQPNACVKCGPRVWFEVVNHNLKVYSGQDPILQAIDLLKKGGIIALKGLGGFHICCNAEDEDVVSRLRQKKRRSNKPFAIMLPDVSKIKSVCFIDEQEERLITDVRKPIVLLKKRNIAGFNIAPSVAPNNRYLGCMLPYTPLHYLLFFQGSNGSNFNALVMTSGNIAEEPIVKDNGEALEKLSNIVDAFLFHNREIFTRVDDSVIKVFSTRSESINLPIFIRRARGFVPEPIKIGGSNREVIGCGSDIKNVFAITKGEYAILSQHIGDMENDATAHFFEETLRNLSAVYRFNPSAVGFDLNPDYYSSRLGMEISDKLNIQAFRLQHHECHIASVVAEWGLDAPVIGVSFDGAGYGWDGNIWGSEFMFFDGFNFKRLARFEELVLPGGDIATKQCWRPAISFLRRNLTDSDYWQYVERLGFIKRHGMTNIKNITKMIDNKISSTISSGAGRYFDAVASLIDACQYNTYEGESGITLESLAHQSRQDSFEQYPYRLAQGKGNKDTMFVIDFEETTYAIINDIINGINKEIVAMRFHNTIVSIVVNTLKNLTDEYKTDKVVFSGGVWQNDLLLKKTSERLINHGLKVYFNSKVPLNDGGIALGQVYLIKKYLDKGVKR
ncbi:MAG: carbamoyltransferase HypF [Thermodesulfovibrionales bacterium]|nr:carbamoyltransferase HypF [Thermodesulfovibrionales bacterium]